MAPELTVMLVRMSEEEMENTGDPDSSMTASVVPHSPDPEVPEDCAVPPGPE